MYANQIFYFNPETDDFLPIFSETVIAVTRMRMGEAAGIVGLEVTKEERRRETVSFNWTGEKDGTE